MNYLMLFLLLAVLIGDAVLIFVSLLYAPTWLWIVAYMILAGSVALGFYFRRRSKTFWGLALIGSLIVNSHYLFITVRVPNIQIIGWGIGLLLAQSLMLFLMLTLSPKVMAR